MFLGFVNEITVLNLQCLTLLKEVSTVGLHLLIMIFFEAHQFIFVSLVEIFDVILQLTIPILLIGDLCFIIFLNFLKLTLVLFPLHLQPPG